MNRLAAILLSLGLLTVLTLTACKGSDEPATATAADTSTAPAVDQPAKAPRGDAAAKPRDRRPVFLAREADADGDGSVTAGERQAFLAAMVLDASGNVDTTALLGADRPVQVRILDADKDGAVSREEVEAALARVDRDGDGEISGAEMRRKGSRGGRAAGAGAATPDDADELDEDLDEADAG